MQPVKKKSKSKHPPATPGQSTLLIVDDEPSMIELVDDMVARNINCRILSAGSIKQAKKIFATQSIDMLVADIQLPDGDGLSLLPSLREHHPNASAIVITGAPSVDGAVQAIRQGFLDFIPKPFSADQITERVRTALARHDAAAKVERRLERMRDAVRRLSAARKVVSKKVDLLCNDLVGAYSELSRQFDTVRTQESFRAAIGSAKDMEQVLCHAMDWMLRQIGYCNVAIWLAADEQQFQLGAYMKYTIPGEPPLTTAMKNGLVPMVQREGVVRLTGDEADERLTPSELEYLSDQAVLGVNCTYLSEPLASVILFRDSTKPFTIEDEEALKTIGPVFACTLAAIVRESISDPLPGEDTLHEEDSDNPERTSEEPDRKSDADWWKRGEAPPF
ncbi:MAG TPA: response regulator [Tepidisphaeraceae bacterium]|jgi:FixJ family two-component response regulator|nr:response regulator [Tepidisphaeraceae bacterium]